MTTLPPLSPFDSDLDLVLERTVDVTPELVWKAWTEPQHLVHWFTPAPWKTIDCAIDLRPGGRFHTVMQSPEGDTMPSDGCYLEVVPLRRLVFTDALLPGYRPSAEPFFTAAITLEASDGGTKYTARAMHGVAATREQHAKMGFLDGWGAALDQLVGHVKAL